METVFAQLVGRGGKPNIYWFIRPPDVKEPSAFENAARYPNYKTKVQCCDDRPMSWPRLVKLGLRTSEKALSILPYPKKLHAKTC